MGIPVQGLDQVEAWTGTGAILPPGVYSVVIDDASEEKTRESGYDMLALTFSNPEGQIRDWLVVIPSTFGKVRQFVEAVGLDASGLTSLEAQQFIGKRLKIRVALQPGNKGDMVSKVVAYMPVDSDVPTGVEGNGASSGSDEPPLPF